MHPQKITSGVRCRLANIKLFAQHVDKVVNKAVSTKQAEKSLYSGELLTAYQLSVLLLMGCMMEKIMFPKSTGYTNMESKKVKKE